jgi:tRNA(Ile)-lysidine synthase
MDFSPAALKHALSACPGTSHYWVAFSGGVDSHVLLHALAALRPLPGAALGAVHVNHGLQADAGHWQEHCRAVCQALDLPYADLRVDGRSAAGESPEAAARQARYRVLREWLPRGHCLLTAQHLDDQAETLLLQLLRGSGVRGLAAMPPVAGFGAGHLLRPLLDFTRQSMVVYARHHDLQWIEDPSNADTGIDRNYLRHRVLPVLRERWPAVSETLARSAGHCAEAADLLTGLAAQDITALSRGGDETLPVVGLRQLPPARRRNVLRHWIAARGGAMPSTAVLSRVEVDILDSRVDAEPCVCIGRHEIRRYRDRLYLVVQLPDPPQDRVLDWDIDGPLELPDAGGVMTVREVTGSGIRRSAVQRAVQVTFRHGGERCRPAGRRHHHVLKKLLQEQGVPPWERRRLPLIYIGDRLAAVAGLWVCEPFAAAPGEAGLEICWLHQPPHAG